MLYIKSLIDEMIKEWQVKKTMKNLKKAILEFLLILAEIVITAFICAMMLGGGIIL